MAPQHRNHSKGRPVLTRCCPGQHEAPVPPGGRSSTSPFAFVCFAAIELAFVLGLVLTQLPPAQVLQIAGGTTAISVGGFFGRNALIIVGRRLLFTWPGDR